MSDDDKNIGRLIAGRYRLDDLLGRGGFGSVYRGWDSQIGRDVAVKLLDVTNRARSAQQTAELRERFRREAMAAGRISHHGVVTIYDFGVPEDDGEAYLVMELLEGHDLAVQLRDAGPMQPDRVKRLFIPMLEALGRGHELGIVHKDIKPQNIFFCHPGTNSESFCLVDFGVARVVHEDKLTMTGLIVGTPQYMAPEYITDTLVTPALDVYQMALILVELITGVPAVPAGESFVKSCNRHFTGDLEIPEELLEGDFGRMLQMALRPIAKERLQDATKFAEMFAEIDPTSIVIDTASTMVFMRRDSGPVDTLAEPPMFPPMNPAQVSAELERIERGSDAYEHAPDTPVGLASVEARVVAPVAAKAAEAPQPAPQPAPDPPPVATPERVPAAPVTADEPVTAPEGSKFPLWVLAIAFVALLMGIALMVFTVKLGQREPEPAKPTPAPIVAVPIEMPQEPTTAPPPDDAAAVMTRITSEPSGARIIVNGKEVGTTPGEVAIGSSDAAELHLDGYEVALVKIEPDLETIALTRLRGQQEQVRPTAEKTKARLQVGKPFVPEEPANVVEPDEPDEPEEPTETGPTKFKSTKENKRPERYDKPEVYIAP